MKRVLVTGSAGFLGSNLSESLLRSGCEVIGFDNFYTGSRENTSRLEELYPKFRFFEGDVLDLPDHFGELTHIYNLACPASPPKYQKDPIYTLKISVLGVMNLAEMAESKGAKLLHTSTSEVYGDPKEHPQREAYWGHVNPIGIRSCYDEGKRCAETYLMDMHRMTKNPIKIVRIFNTYGPYMAADDGRVVSNFIIQALKGEDITIYGKGEQTRSFCYVDDLVRGMISFMDLESPEVGPINLGNPIEFTVMELAEKVLSKIDSKSKLRFEPLPSDDPIKRKPDIQLAKSTLGWEPKIFLDEGLDLTINYFKQKLMRESK